MPNLTKTYFPSIVILLAFVIGITGTEFLVNADNRSHDAFHEVELSSRGSLLRNTIEREINTTLQLSTGLIIYVASHPEIDDAKFVDIASSLIEKSPNILNIGLARDNIISHIYPLEGNEKALGLDYMNMLSQRDAVLKAINNEATVIAGPVNLVQGGQGLIGRIPIFRTDTEQTYWGMASVVVDFIRFKNMILNLSNELGIKIALKGRDAKGGEGDIFLGQESLFELNSNKFLAPISLPVGEWLLAADYTALPSNQNRTIVFRTIGYCLTLLISFLIFLLLRSYKRQRHLSLHDTLTGLANRRLFDLKVKYSLARAKRNKSLFSLIYIDLDGFKAINDTYGHKEGDKVLVFIAEKIQSALRESDFAARMGGDEFVIVLEDLKSAEDVDRIISTLEKVLISPITLDNNAVNIGASMGVAIYPNDGHE